MLLRFLHRNTHDLFRRMTLLISYSVTGTRIKTGSFSDWTQVQPLVCSDFYVPVGEGTLPWAIFRFRIFSNYFSQKFEKKITV